MSASDPTVRPAGPPQPKGLALAPFRALRFADRLVGAPGGLAALTSPPYDVIDEAERSALEAADEHNVVRLILPRDDAGDPYERAAETLSRWRAEGVLVRDEAPGLYVYELTEPSGHVVRGLVGALALAQPDVGIGLPHENTMAGPVADRLALTRATGTNLEPILLLYAGGGGASDVVDAAAAAAPIVEGTTADGIGHRVWAITDPDQLAAVADDLLPRRATIADGHHRYATYLQWQAERHAAGAGPGPWDFGLTMLIDAARYAPAVHGIHRVVPSLPLPDAAARAERGFRVTETTPGPDALEATEGPAFVITDGTRAYLLDRPDPGLVEKALAGVESAAVRRLEVTVAHRFLVQELWGLADTDDVVGYRHSVDDAVAAVGSGGTALLLRPTPVEAVLAVAAEGARMPRKSTLFTPKPRTGLLLRPVD